MKEVDFYSSKKDKPKVVAEMYLMNGKGPDKCLCIKAKGHYIWFYEDGDISVQSGGFSDNPIKQFYEGETITIKF